MNAVASSYQPPPLLYTYRRCPYAMRARLPDGQVLEQSWDIMRWALSADPEGWWSLGQTARNLDLLARNDGPFKQQLDRYKYPERHGLSDPTQAREPAWWVVQPLPALQAWLTCWLGSPLLLACMVKLPGQQALRFPLEQQ